MTTSPSDTPTGGAPEDQPVEDAPQQPVVGDGEGYAETLTDAVGGTSHTFDNDTLQIRVERDRWVEAVAAAAVGLPFFSWLSGMDWSREVAVGEPVADIDALEERFEVLCRVSSVSGPEAAILVTTVPKDDPTIASIVDVFPGAGWHEREAHEMFGIDFEGNPNQTHLYLPDSFEGHPLRKSFPLLSREVKPWPGTVDVEDMPKSDAPKSDAPSTENPEAPGDSS